MNGTLTLLRRRKVTTMKKWIGGGLAVLLLASLAVKQNKFRLAYYESRLLQAKRQLFALEKQGKAYRPAHQILTETKWICSATRDYPRMGNVCVRWKKPCAIRPMRRRRTSNPKPTEAGVSWDLY